MWTSIRGLAKHGIAPHAVLHGYVEIQYQWPWAAVCATVRNVDTVHSVIFIYGLQPPLDAFPAHATSAHAIPTDGSQVHTLEGMWWKQERDVTGFVALANVTQSPINVTLQLNDSENKNLESHTVTVLPHRTKMMNLTELRSTTNSAGGIVLTYDGPEHGLVVNGGLEDESTGYSAHLPLVPLPMMPAPGESPEVLERTYAELGLMSGAADPMMSFPAGTTYKPYSLIRNVSGQPLSVTPKIWWMEGAIARSAALPQFVISPHQTVSMDVTSLMVNAGLKNFNGSMNLVLDTKGEPGALAMASGSVDQKTPTSLKWCRAE